MRDAVYAVHHKEDLKSLGSNCIGTYRGNFLLQLSCLHVCICVLCADGKEETYKKKK